VAQVVLEFHQLGARAGLGEQRLLRLLHLADLVDQAQPLRLLGEVGPGLQRLLQGGGIGLAVGRRADDGAPVDRAHPRQLRFAVLGRVVTVEVRVDRVLVFLALLEVDLDPVLVEGALEEDVFGGQAGHLQRGGRLHPQLVGGSAQHVGRGHDAGRIDALAVGEHRLAGGAEPLERLPQLVGRRRGHAGFRQPNQHALHPPVALRALQALDDAHHRHRPAADGYQRVLRVLVGQPVAKVELQHGLGGQGLRPGRGSRHHHQQHGHGDDEDDQASEHAGHGDEELLHGSTGSPQGKRTRGPEYRLSPPAREGRLFRRFGRLRMRRRAPALRRGEIYAGMEKRDVSAACPNGRSGRIRTCDPRVPNTVLYQTELHSDLGAGLIEERLKRRKRARRRCIGAGLALSRRLAAGGSPAAVPAGEWCNGNTAVFGTVILGSSPSSPATSSPH
jgi:hypothetical protein